MGFAEEKMWLYVRENLSDFHSVTLVDLFDHLSTTLIQPEREALQATLSNSGNQRTVFPFLDSLRRRKDWVNKLIQALRICDHTELADRLESRYNELQIRNRPESNASLPPPPQSSPFPQATLSPPPSYSSVVHHPPSNEPSGDVNSTPHATSKTAHSPQTAVPSVTEGPQPLPENQTKPQCADGNSSPITTSCTSPFQTNLYEAFEVLSTPISESQQPVTLTEDNTNNNMTQPTEKAAVEVPSRLPSISSPASRGMNAAASNLEPSARRKETGLQRKGTQDETLDRHMKQVSENVSRQPQSPTSALATNRNATGTTLRSQIPRKPLHSPPSREPRDQTSSPAPTENRPENYEKEKVIDRKLPGRPSTHADTRIPRATRASAEEDEQGFSKPGVLTSDVRENVSSRNPAIQPLPGVGENSSVNSGRLVFSKSTEASSSSVQPVKPSSASGDSSSGNVQVPVLPQQPPQEMGLDDSGSSVFTVRSDPLMISSSSCSNSSTDSMPYDVAKEPEEDHFSFSASAEIPDEDQSMGGTMSYTVNVVEGASTDNYDANMPSPPVSPSNTSPSGRTLSQRSDHQAGNNNDAFSHLILPTVVVVLVGAILIQMFRYLRK